MKNVGLFGCIDDAKIKNVGVVNCNIVGRSNVGGLAGNSGTTLNTYNTSYIEDCYTTGSVVGQDTLGGLVGYSNRCELKTCSSTADVSGHDVLGGLIGCSRSIILVNSYATGNVVGNYRVGGLLGYGYGAIVNCYAAGHIMGDSAVGGLCGYNSDVEKYSDGVDNSFWDIESSNIDSSSGGTGKTTAEMKTQSTFTDVYWNFEYIWTIDPTKNNGYPILDNRIPQAPTEIEEGYTIIKTSDQLMWLALTEDAWYGHYKLGNDIDMQGYRWTPIGGDNYKSAGDRIFSGEFDGQGHIISNLKCDMANIDDIGLFGFVGDAQIKNLGIVNCNIIGNNNVGGLVGEIVISKIENCYATGNVIGNDNIGIVVGSSYSMTLVNTYATGNVVGNNNVGGLVGEVGNGKIENCYTTGTVVGQDSLGGLIGYQHSGYVKTCSSSVDVSGQEALGGLIGNSLYTMILNSYATGNVDGNYRVGGLLGAVSRSGYVLNSYATGTVKGDSAVGGLCGYNMEKVENCFWDIESSNIDSSSGGVGKTTAEMKTQSTFTDADWNFEYIWSIDPTKNNGYPIFDNRIPLPPTEKEEWYTIIRTSDDLMWLALTEEAWFRSYKLGNDIDMQGYQWTPIGRFDSYCFSGEFDGQGYMISNLQCDMPHTNYVGLFGYLYNAKIKNMGIVNCNIVGNNNAGVLVGMAEESKIENCYTTGLITGTNNVGGLIGTSSETNILNCYSKAGVMGSSKVGGFVGEFDDASTATNCYAAGRITGDSAVGGFCGYNNKCRMEQCFWDIESSNIDSSAGGKGKTTAEMKTKSTFTDAGWDFETIWDISADINDGYPFLKEVTVAVIESIVATTNLTCAPNPCSTSSKIGYSVNNAGFVNIAVYDIQGNEITTLVNNYKNAGSYEAIFNVSELPAGVYFISINTAETMETKKINVIR
jgi:hypothetical protein